MVISPCRSFVVRQAVTGDAGNIDVITSTEKGVAQVCELLWACAYAVNHHDGFGGFFAVGFNNRSTFWSNVGI